MLYNICNLFKNKYKLLPQHRNYQGGLGVDILRDMDMAMDDKLIFTSNQEKQYCPFCRLKLLTESLDIARSNVSTYLKFKPTNEKTCINEKTN